ncbi:PD-(D/E)XK nuclease family protein [Pirellula sp. SH-Sr6A]|uniref:PD-(D/E)XK nuclease family protein n=1 Tax=Pirellula sp. SH-Sr6A TaxID=1632865 RepID=UPI00143C3015|nr:PD-(D/E)XK nuclease family protein [Pirellula sp. SH-Sr6A]
MRNIFDQYEQPENRLTHALATVLGQSPKLLVDFLKWLGISEIPKASLLAISQQQVPGVQLEDVDEEHQKGLPDLAIFDDDNWVVLFECKVQAKVTMGQLERHRKTAQRNGYDSPWIVVLTVDELENELPPKTVVRSWREVYSWFNQRVTDSFWAIQLVDYMRPFEQKMLARNYQIRGTITVFDGLRFDDKNPYSYREAKRLIRLLGDLLQSRKDLHKIGVDPDGKRRHGITSQDTDSVWDFLPLVAARGVEQFTAFPHLTISINRRHAVAAITIPNGVRGGFRTKLVGLGIDGFLEVVRAIESGLRPVLKKSPNAKPMLYATQRHYYSQRSDPEVDGRMDADLRTAIQGNGASTIKYQPEWVEAIYSLLVNKRSNIQLGFEVHFPYSCKRIRSDEAVDLFAAAWIAMSPILDLAVDG